MTDLERIAIALEHIAEALGKPVQRFSEEESVPAEGWDKTIEDAAHGPLEGI